MTENIDQIKQEISPVVLDEQNITIDSSIKYSAGADFLKRIKFAQKRVVIFFSGENGKDGMKPKAHAAWKQICAQEATVLAPLFAAEDSIKSKMLVFQREENHKAAAEEARLQANADAQAALEYRRKMKEAEKLKTPALKEQRLAEAEEVEAPIVRVQTETPKVAGISTRKTWKAEVVNKFDFLRAAAIEPANVNMLGFIIIDESALNKVAAATKGQVKYPGIRFYEHETMAAGGR